MPATSSKTSYIRGHLTKRNIKYAKARPATFWPEPCSSTGSARCATAALRTSAIVLWNTVYLERAIQAIRDHGQPVDENLLQHVSLLGWEHINLTGDYVWRQDRRVKEGNSGLSERSPRLSVLYIPFREVTLYWKCSRWPQLGSAVDGDWAFRVAVSRLSCLA
jgi:hypothetical protein